MDPFTDGRRVRFIKWPDGEYVQDNADCHFHGHRDPNGDPWVVQFNENGEVGRHNAKYFAWIEWY